MSITLHINNSFCNFKGVLPDIVSNSIKELLTYQNDIGAQKVFIFYKDLP